ncbi:hypothetical protein K458DRAFT_397445 [Lentithecium fluviatile CBS 122367]|uniref:Uncharacterized protein n=1 Tax=Lentithecium fluviatile CBS 122367 TaxID=1168545 RepID=A0A6G1ICV9_9PLEO|nr:hypothetical protein K458DRAFT_397445 [Lentithecium fluviatile CBS 122367]
MRTSGSYMELSQPTQEEEVDPVIDLDSIEGSRDRTIPTSTRNNSSLFPVVIPCDLSQMTNFSRPHIIAAHDAPPVSPIDGANTFTMISRPALLRSSASSLRWRQSVEDGMSELPLGDVERSVPDVAATLRTGSQRQLSGTRQLRYQPSLPSPREDVEQTDFPSAPPSRHASSEIVPSSRKPVNKARYYSHALSDIDKQALTVGEIGDNLREWSSADLLWYQDARVELVPFCENRAEVLMAIAKDKRHSEEFVLQTQKNQEYLSQLLSGGLQQNESERGASLSRDSTQSMIDLRVPSGLGQTSEPSPRHSSEMVQRSLPSSPRGEPQTRLSRSGRARNSDYFARRHDRHISAQSRASSLSTESDSRVRSPLAQEFKADAATTFDSFLVPHKSGKGETHRDSENASKEPETPDSDSVGSFPRRLSKMPSMDMMRQRLSKRPSRNLLESQKK